MEKNVDAMEMLLKEFNVTGISTDSRTVQEGHIFVCIPSLNADSSRMEAYIAEAIHKGAFAIVAEASYADFVPDHVLFVSVDSPRMALAQLCNVFYQPKPETIVAITGTNGKSSVSHFAYQIWRQLGVPSASLGTLGISSTQEVLETDLASHTTPDAVTLHQILARCATHGVSHVALEASSHGLDQNRLHGITLKAAAFTNLTQDHMDYHIDFDDYFVTKARLFYELLGVNHTAVIYRGDPYAERLIASLKEKNRRMLIIGETEADMIIEHVEATATGSNVGVRYNGENYHFHLPLIGRFQVENALVALGLVMVTGVPLPEVVPTLEKLEAVRGRMQRVGLSQIFVDYAHTPDGLRAALTSLRPHVKGKLWLVFGCGGDRDKQKRPLMGQIAAQYADQVIITDDNPRGEDPSSIRHQILQACPRAFEVADRAEAIRYAIAHKGDDDTILIAGKGHEKYQWIGDQRIEFDDVSVAKNMLESQLIL